MRLLGVDFGGKRIGLATGDTASRLPEPRGVVATSGTLAKDAMAIRDFAQSENISDIVIGLPLDENGETKMSRICRIFGQRVEDLGLKVYYVDESLTSQASAAVMREAGLGAAAIRKRVDAEAACRILERFMEEYGKEA